MELGTSLRLEVAEGEELGNFTFAPWLGAADMVGFLVDKSIEVVLGAILGSSLGTVLVGNAGGLLSFIEGI